MGERTISKRELMQELDLSCDAVSSMGGETQYVEYLFRNDRTGDTVIRVECANSVFLLWALGGMPEIQREVISGLAKVVLPYRNDEATLTGNDGTPLAKFKRESTECETGADGVVMEKLIVISITKPAAILHAVR